MPEDVIRRAVEQYSAGKAVDFDALRHRYPEIAQELESRVRLALGVVDAARDNQDKSAAGPNADDEHERHEIETLNAQLNGYRILEQIYCGGQGTVYKALQIATSRIVALKVLHGGPVSSERQRSRFLREVRVTSRLRHPGIVTIYDSAFVAHRPFCVMEFIEGEPIDDHALLHNLGVTKRVALFLEVVKAVNAAHLRGIIHRDLKPSNILVDLEGKPMVLDFGLAKISGALADAEGPSPLTVTGNVLGTLPYLSPEQASGFEEIDVRSDIYTLGVVLFQLITGGFPYPVSDDRQSARRNIMSTKALALRQVAAREDWDDPGYLTAITVDLEAVVARALEKRREDRYQSAAAFAEDLERLLAGEPVQARADRALYIMRKTIRRYRIHMLIGACFLLVLGAATVVSTEQWLAASRERDLARQTATIANDTLQDVVGEIDDNIATLVGGIEVRDRLMPKIQQQFAKLEKLVAHDDSMVDGLMTLEEKQGDLLRACGDQEAAHHKYERALRRLEQIWNDEQPTIDQLLFGARINRKLGEITAGGDGYLAASCALIDAALARDGASARAAVSAARTYLEQARQRYEAGDYRGALQSAVAAEAALRNAADTKTITDATFLELLASIHEQMANALMWLGRGEESQAALDCALSDIEAAAQHAASHRQIRARYQCLLGRVAKKRANDGQHAEAIEYYMRSLRELDYLRLTEPTSVEWTFEACIIEEDVADQQWILKNYSQAATHADASVKLARELLSIDENNLSWQQQLGVSLMTNGKIFQASATLNAAVLCFEEAAEVLHDLSEKSPADFGCMLLLAKAHNYLGSCAAAAGIHDSSITEYIEALNLYQSLARRQPGVAQRRLDLVHAMNNVAFAHLVRVKSIRTHAELLTSRDVILYAQSGTHQHQFSRIRMLDDAVFATLYRLQEDDIGSARELLREAQSVLLQVIDEFPNLSQPARVEELQENLDRNATYIDKTERRTWQQCLCLTCLRR